MEPRARRASDALRAVDGVVDSYLRHSELGGRRIANLAATIAIENSGARSGALLLDDGNGLNPTIAIRDDLTALSGGRESGDQSSVRRAEDTAKLVVDEGMLAVPIVLDGRVKGVLTLNDFAQPPGESIQELANGVASRIAGLLKNAELLEALDRSNHDLDALARLSEQLAVGLIGDEHLREALEHAVRGTRSDAGILAVFSRRGALESLVCQGVDEIEAHGQLSQGFDLGASQEDELRRLCPGAVLVESLSDDALRRKTDPAAGGLLAISRPMGDGYQLSERSFLHAIANLLSGALARREYFRKASEDELTATGSRFALQLALAEAEGRSHRTRLPFSVLVADIDQFKEVNDDFGHLAGDTVLKSVANVLRSRLRALDSVARYGGDEFVVVLPDTDAGPATRLADELCRLVRESRFAGLERSVSVSLGVADSSAGQTAAETLRQADLALYESKKQGRNRVTRYRGKRK